MPTDDDFKKMNAEIQQLNEKFQNERLARAEDKAARAGQHIEHMRNWLGMYTLMMSVLLLGFAALGYRGYSDIEANRKRAEEAAAAVGDRAKRAEEAVQQANARLEAFREREKRVDEVLEKTDRTLAAVDSKLRPFEERVANLNGQVEGIRKKTNELDQGVNATLRISGSTLRQTDNLSSLVLQSGLGLPAIASAPCSISSSGQITGLNFGDTRGTVFVRPATSLGSTPTQRLTGLDTDFSKSVPAWLLAWLHNPDPVQLEDSSVGAWSDREIVLQLSSKDIQQIEISQSKFVAAEGNVSAFGERDFKVKTTSGSESHWYQRFDCWMSGERK
jgi:archaellum component FlaC